LIVFTSKKAYKAFAGSEAEQDNIKYTVHPCCKYWRSSVNQGRKYFEALISQYKYDKSEMKSVGAIKADFMRDYLNDIYDGLEADGLIVSKGKDYDDRINKFYLEEKDTRPGFTVAKGNKRYRVEIAWRLYLIDQDDLDEWWYLPTRKRKPGKSIDFRHLYDAYVADDRENTIVQIVEAIESLV